MPGDGVLPGGEQMHHIGKDDFKKLLWGPHLQRMLSAWGHLPASPSPPPAVARLAPLWYRRLAAALTLLGIIGAFRMLDRALAPSPEIPVRQADMSSFDTATWNEWALRLHLRLDPLSPLASPSPTGSDELAGDSVMPEEAADRAEAEKPAGGPAGIMPVEGPPPDGHVFRTIVVTAYSSGENKTDDTPHLTATNSTTDVGTIALSRDLLRTFTLDAPFDFGDRVLIPGVGIFEVKDTMAARWRARGDIWFTSRERALQWGRRQVYLTQVEEDTPLRSQLH